MNLQDSFKQWKKRRQPLTTRILDRILQGVHNADKQVINDLQRVHHLFRIESRKLRCTSVSAHVDYGRCLKQLLALRLYDSGDFTTVLGASSYSRVVVVRRQPVFARRLAPLLRHLNFVVSIS